MPATARSLTETSSSLKLAIHDVAAKVFKPVVNPIRKKRHMSESTSNLLKERMQGFESTGRNNEEITPELKKVWTKLIYRSMRQDYKSWITDIVRQMEVADGGKGDVKAVHRLAGVLQGKWKRGSTNIAKVSSWVSSQPSPQARDRPRGANQPGLTEVRRQAVFRKLRV